VAKLVDTLTSYGCKTDPADFKKTVVAVFKSRFKGKVSTEDMLCDPMQAIEYCEAVRGKLRAKVPNPVILKTLINERKQSRVPRMAQR
jgi:hypothetical protein